jgi:hypothetical protein
VSFDSRVLKQGPRLRTRSEARELHRDWSDLGRDRRDLRQDWYAR